MRFSAFQKRLKKLEEVLIAKPPEWPPTQGIASAAANHLKDCGKAIPEECPAQGPIEWALDVLGEWAWGDQWEAQND